MGNKSGLAFMAVGGLLLAAALGLTAYNIQDGNRAAEEVAHAATELRARTDEIAQVEVPDFVIPAYEIDPRVEMPVTEIDGNYYVGTISIPALDLELPVLNEWSYPNLKIAPCRYNGSAYLNNMIIAAHNYKRHFGQLVNLNVGDMVRFTDMAGNVFTYSVAAMEQLRPNQTRDMLEANGYGGYDLTLFTCTIGGRQRFTVRCVQEEQTQA